MMFFLQNDSAEEFKLNSIQSVLQKQNNQKFISCLLATILIITFTDQAYSQQRRNSNVASLGEKRCLQVEKTDLSGDPKYIAVNYDVAVGRELFRAVAYLGAIYFSDKRGFAPNNTSPVTCRLAPLDKPSKFSTLTLSFGFQNKDFNWKPARNAYVNLSIYLDDQLVVQKVVRKGERFRVPLNIRNKRTIAFEVECFGVTHRNSTCPGLYIFEDVLE